MKHTHRVAILLAVFVTGLCAVDAAVLYQTDFDGMTLTATEFYPGYPDHDGWFLLNAPPYGYGQIQETVDEQTQTLEEFALPRSDDAGVWIRGQMIESIQTMIVPDDNFENETDDDIYWDNISLTGSCPLQADLTGDCDVDLEDLAIMAAEWLT